MNSLHNQGIDKLAPGVVVEGIAPDGTIEAVHVVATAAGPVPGFAVGVQWHPENDWRHRHRLPPHLRRLSPRRCMPMPRTVGWAGSPAAAD